MATKNKHIVHDGEAFDDLTKDMSPAGKVIAFIIVLAVSILLIVLGGVFSN